VSAAPGPAVAADRPAPARAFVQFYATAAKVAVMTQFQYRVANVLWMVGWVVESVVYLVVWTEVADALGGSVGGLTRGNVAAYYIAWTLVRNMNITHSPGGWQWRIRRGELSAWLLRPVNVIHWDLAYFGGWKVVAIALWFPIAIVLTLVFDPTFEIAPLQVPVFLLAIWFAFALRTLCLSVIGLTALWTTRTAAIAQLYVALELFLSGRLVPLQLMPRWIEVTAAVLPFSSTFGFPTQALAGPISTPALLFGLALQLGWTVGVALLYATVWRRAVGRYTAVGN
jgi:ABC-2 type transport system permease protein